MAVVTSPGVGWFNIGGGIIRNVCGIQEHELQHLASRAWGRRRWLLQLRPYEIMEKQTEKNMEHKWTL